MPDPDESPAVTSLKDEQAAQSRRTETGDLEEALEDTFPASDPVSITQTSIAAVRADSSDDKLAGETEFPLVDIALASGRNRDDEDNLYQTTRAEIDALKAEVERLTESMSEIAWGTARIARGEVKSRIHDFEDKVRQRPLMSLSIAAAIGYIWGATR